MKAVTPRSIGVIMDGNRRWAKSRGLPTLFGHRKGYEKLHGLTEWCRAHGIKNLIVYAFSTENWNRSAEEVSYLMDLFREMIEKEVEEAKQKDTRLIFPGERTRFAPEVLRAIERAEEETRGGKDFTFAIALSYGGRSEIIDAIHRVKGDVREVTEECFSELLFTKDIPDPDLIIRTSGEKRLSGFLPWQSVYSELFFVDTPWPDFTREEFENILDEYGERQRRFGK